MLTLDYEFNLPAFSRVFLMCDIVFQVKKDMWFCLLNLFLLKKSNNNGFMCSFKK